MAGKVIVAGAPVRQMVGGAGGSGFAQRNQVVRPNDREIFHQPLYDRQNLATGSLTGDVSFFVTPVGGSQTLIRYETAASVAKTKRDTNLPSNGQDPSKDYAVFGMACAFIPVQRDVSNNTATDGIRRDIDNIREGGYINFKIIDKQILDLPLILVPEVNAAGAISTTMTATTIYGGAQAMSAMWSFGEPIMIPKATYFTLKMTFDGTITLNQAYDVYMFLFAKVRRPV